MRGSRSNAASAVTKNGLVFAASAHLRNAQQPAATARYASPTGAQRGRGRRCDVAPAPVRLPVSPASRRRKHQALSHVEADFVQQDEAAATSVGLTRRLAAASYDLLLLIALWMLTSAMFLPLNDGNAPAPGTALFAVHRIALVVIAAAFYASFWKFGGQTLGMRAWKLELVRDDGAPLTWSDCVRRLLAAVVSILPAGAGFWWILLNAKNRAWHDSLSGTHLRKRL